jgi:hypothetical protein
LLKRPFAPPDPRRIAFEQLGQRLRAHHFDDSGRVVDPGLDAEAIAAALRALAEAWTPAAFYKAMDDLRPRRDGEEHAARELLKMADGATADWVNRWVGSKTRSCSIRNEASWRRICGHVEDIANMTLASMEQACLSAGVSLVDPLSSALPIESIASFEACTEILLPDPILVDNIDFDVVAESAQALLTALEDYERRAKAYEHKAYLAVLNTWQPVGVRAIALEQLLTQQGASMRGGQLMPPVRGSAKKCRAVEAVIEWLLSARGSADGWGEKADGRWTITVKTEVRPEVDRMIAQLRLIVDDLRCAADVSAESPVLTTVGGDAENISALEPQFLSALDLAARLGRPVTSIAKALERLRKKLPDCFIENGTRRKSDPTYLYRVSEVLPHLRERYGGST